MAEHAPIADLSYRNYDGQLESPHKRWRVIARDAIKRAVRSRPFWILTGVASWYYLIMTAMMYFMDQVVDFMPPEMVKQFFSQIVWHDLLLNGLGSGQMMWMALGLVLGAGAIANDNRTNALLVYLSKPTSKTDYLIGKFIGLAVPLLLSMAIPTLFFVLYGALNWRHHGFLTDDPWMIPKMFVVLPVAASFQAAILLGYSSLAQNGRVAGAVYAGFYFITKFFVFLLTGVGRWNRLPEAIKPLADQISYLTIDGLPYGLAKVIWGTDGSPFWVVNRRMEHVVTRPNPMIVVPIMVGIAALALSVAWSRIRAVEVVK